MTLAARTSAGVDYDRLTRPYALTGGRTTPVDEDVALEALVEVTWEGHDALGDLTFEAADIIRLTRETLSVAEVAARLSLPLGVARVLVADLAAEGYVLIHPPRETADDGRQDPGLLAKVLDGLRSM